MSVFVTILFGIVILIMIFYIVRYIINKGSGNNYLVTTTQPLDVKKDIMFPDQTQKQLLGSSGSTVMGFFKLENGDRTLNVSNEFIPLLQVENNWYLEISPAPVQKQSSSTRLRVQTNDAGVRKYEVITLPDIPKQKWVFIAILREGRRFDIIYDNQIVASQRLENYPVVISSPLSVGNKGLSGSVSNVIVNGQRLTPDEVERERSRHVDTNNILIEISPIDFSFLNLSVFKKCAPGLPCEPVTSPPSNKLLQWKTPYA
jgi:hypothetical protein